MQTVLQNINLNNRIIILFTLFGSKYYIYTLIIIYLPNFHTKPNPSIYIRVYKYITEQQATPLNHSFVQ